MVLTAKTVIAIYGRLDRYAEEFTKVIRHRAENSFYDRTPCEIQAEKILELIAKKDSLIALKRKVRRALSMIDAEDRAVLAARFKKKSENLYLSRRTFFRKLAIAMKKFIRQLELQGVDKHTFEEEYIKVFPFISITYDMLAEEEERAADYVKNLSPNSSLRGVYREVAKESSAS